MNIDLNGKTALVTGSTGGIGPAIAKGLATAGATVSVKGRTQNRVDAALTDLKRAVPGPTPAAPRPTWAAPMAGTP